MSEDTPRGSTPTDGSHDDPRIETLLIGIDAACTEVVWPMLSNGDLPNLQAVLDDGIGTSLQSQIPPWTASAWPSMYTGVNPGKHGVYGFLTYEGYDWDVVDMGDVNEMTLWEILSRHDKSSVVVNVPVTSPPSAFDGALIPGYTAPEEPDCHPEGLLEEVVEACGEYRVYPDTERDPMEEYTDLVGMRGDAFCHLADEVDPAFGFVQFQVTDTVFHQYPDRPELVDAIYAAVDDQIGRLLERYDPETVVIASDHGMGRYNQYEFRVNEYLKRNDHLDDAVGGDGMPAWLPILNEELRHGDRNGDGTEAPLMRRLVASAARAGLTPERVLGILEPLHLDGLVSRVVPTSATRAGQRHVDFPASEAYMRSRIECGVRLNVEGREPDGVIPEEDYEAVREELVDLFVNVDTPDGTPVFEEVAYREQYFWGPHTDEAVDIVLIPNEFDQFLSANLDDEVFDRPTEPWNHKLDGLVMLTGAGVDTDADLQLAHLFDVAPTVLASLDVPISDRMDGWVLPAVDATESTSYPRPERRDVDRETAAVEQRLDALGYLEGGER